MFTWSISAAKHIRKCKDRKRDGSQRPSLDISAGYDWCDSVIRRVKDMLMIGFAKYLKITFLAMSNIG
jgi:hypothetical protein